MGWITPATDACCCRHCLHGGHTRQALLLGSSRPGMSLLGTRRISLTLIHREQDHRLTILDHLHQGPNGASSRDAGLDGLVLSGHGLQRLGCAALALAAPCAQQAHLQPSALRETIASQAAGQLALVGSAVGQMV